MNSFRKSNIVKGYLLSSFDDMTNQTENFIYYFIYMRPTIQQINKKKIRRVNLKLKFKSIVNLCFIKILSGMK